MLARTLIACGAGVVLLMARAASGQPAEAPQLSGAVEAAYARFHYYFENPSTFDSTGLVPHNFQQTYWGDNVWLTVTGSYRLLGHTWRSEFSVTPPNDTRGDDVDTFFLAGGDVATSGTTGRIEMQSLRVRQDVDVPLGTWTFHGAYQYRRDRSVFDARQLKTVTHTQPPSSESFVIEGAETTISEVHEVRFGLSRKWRANGWSIDARVDAAPTTYAQLTTYLPFKYPGRAIVFSAPVFTLNPALTISHGSRWPISVRVSGLRTFSYTDSRQFHREMWTIAAGVGRVF